MYIKWIGLAVIFLAGCAPQAALQGIPQLADGADVRIQYYCEDGNIVVEYANRGGHYSALLDAGAGQRVLTVEKQTDGAGIRAVLAPLAWVSEDGQWFDLYDDKTLILNRCHAVAQVEKGNLNINLGRVLGRQ